METLVWDRFETYTDEGDELYVPIIYRKGEYPFDDNGYPNYVAASSEGFETKAECRAWVAGYMFEKGLVWSDEAEGWV